MQFIGQQKNLNIINNWKNLPNFIIIQGDPHMGKRYLVLYLCEKFNLKYKELNKSVSSIRNLISYIEPGSNILFHLDNFETASPQAKNALLKITEEPIEGCYIAITGGPQIKTLESRARKIIMTPFEKSELYECLDKYYDKNIHEKLILCGLNSPAKINYYKDYEHLEALASYAFDISTVLTYISPESILKMMSRFENKYENIDAVMLFLNMLINIIENNIKNKSYFSYYKILNILLKGKKDLTIQPTLKRKLILYDIFYKIYMSNKGSSL